LHVDRNSVLFLWKWGLTIKKGWVFLSTVMPSDFTYSCHVHEHKFLGSVFSILAGFEI
jgi:hypothetical protein